MGLWDWLMGTPGAPRDDFAAAIAPRRDTARALSIGDVVGYDGVDYVVQTAIVLHQGGFAWHEFLLVDAETDRQYWLTVEEDDTLMLSVYEAVGLGLALPPVPETLTHNGVNYRLSEHGTAHATIVREPGAQPSQDTVEFWDYVGANPRQRLAIERWHHAYEAAIGTRIREGQLRIYPHASRE